MRTRTWLGGTMIVVAAMGILGGCQENLKEDNARLMQENLELRQELSDVRNEAREAQMRADLARAERAQPTTTPPARPEETIEMPNLANRPTTGGSNTNAPAAGTSRSSTTPNTPATVARTHTIEKGDSLYRIAQKYYGSGLKWTLIYDANRDIIGPDFNKLVVGKTLTIPPLVSND